MKSFGSLKKVRPAICFVMVLAILPSLGGLSGSARLKPFGLENFSQHYADAVDAYYAAEKLVRAGNYRSAAQGLDNFWQKYPQGDAAWRRLPQTAGGIFTGHPPVYAALLMLTKIANAFRDGKPGNAETLRMTVLLPRSAAGFDPATYDEAQRNAGTERNLRLDSRVTATNYRVIKEATWLFLEYLGALTGGTARWQQSFVELPGKIDLENKASINGRISNNLGAKSFDQIWDSVDARVKKQTDMWLIVHPSNLPSNSELRHAVDFVRGGMARDPQGAPCIVADDLFLLQASPHFKNGEKAFSAMERQLYHPQYFQHEIFHFIFRRYAEFELEKSGHDWHTRGNWPADFVGAVEPDYYAEAFEKRILTSANPVVSIFRFQAAPDRMWKALSPEDLVGTYQQEVVENGWHKGAVLYEDGKYYWKNEAGVRWDLKYNGRGDFETNETNPYFKKYPARGRLFHLQLKRSADGKFENVVAGFSFNGGHYQKVQ